MINRNVVMAGVAMAFLSSGVATAFAQNAVVPTYPTHKRYHRPGTEQYRPLTVGPRQTSVPSQATTAPAGIGTGLGTAVAAPFNAVGIPVAGGIVGGAANLAVAPLNGLFGGQVGISPDPAPPLPIKARFANTGAVETSFDEGFSQDVPVDKSGPIYQIDTTGHERTVTPFTLAAFPITGAASAITSPLRALPHQ